MKILQIYDACDGFNQLALKKNNSFVKVEKFLGNYPKKYSENYYQNKKQLRIIKYDKLLNDIHGEYDLYANEIKLVYQNAFTHELLHMASFNDKTEELAFINPSEYQTKGMALVEGMTEYLASIIDKKKVGAYHFEVFTADMLNTSKNILKYYFIPNYEEFAGLYNEIDFLNLIMSIDLYHHGNIEGDVKNEDIVDAIRNTLEALIIIETSKVQDKQQLKEYRDKFLTLLSEGDLKYILSDYDNNYQRFAKRKIDQKLKLKH